MWLNRFLKVGPNRRKDAALLHRCQLSSVGVATRFEMNGNRKSPLVRKIHLVNGNTTSSLTEDQQYQEAVNQLNQLQSNALTLATHQGTEKKRFEDTWKYLDRCGLSAEDLDKLPVIHVAGTKGKGSVCSFVESIMRQHGLKTGFFSSPHLVSVTERIRLNGVPISEAYFAKQFWSLYRRLNDAKEESNDMPPFFKFLTLMALNVFLAEKVDVAIIEVGIGGLHDCTNVVRKTRTVGITSLGLDHVDVLGDTIEKIAWQKAGIIKQHSNVFTVRQPGMANEVIARQAEDKEAHLTIVPDFAEYSWTRKPNFLNLNDTSVHKLNISLAIQLAFDWLIHKGHLPATQDRRHCSENIIAGIENFHWPGRFQIIDRGESRFYLDGAHTMESIEACLDWYRKTSKRWEPHRGSSFKCLIFYVTGTRDVETLAKPILNAELFDLILICPNIVDSQVVIVDNVNAHTNENDLARKCHGIEQRFRNISNGGIVPIQVLSSVSDALKLLGDIEGGKEKDVLITGSLYLVGTALIALSAQQPQVEDGTG